MNEVYIQNSPRAIALHPINQLKELKNKYLAWESERVKELDAAEQQSQPQVQPIDFVKEEPAPTVEATAAPEMQMENTAPQVNPTPTAINPQEAAKEQLFSDFGIESSVSNIQDAVSQIAQSNDISSKIDALQKELIDFFAKADRELDEIREQALQNVQERTNQATPVMQSVNEQATAPADNSFNVQNDNGNIFDSSSGGMQR